MICRLSCSSRSSISSPTIRLARPRSGCGLVIGAMLPMRGGSSLRRSIARRDKSPPLPLEPRLSSTGVVTRCVAAEEGAMASQDRIYFARRAAEEQELATAAADPGAAEAHRKLQRAYLERASVGERIAHHASKSG